MTADGRLLTARAVADRLDVGTETILRWTRRGELPAVRLPGGALRYRPGELAAWLDARATARPAGGADPPNTTRSATMTHGNGD